MNVKLVIEPEIQELLGRASRDRLPSSLPKLDFAGRSASPDDGQELSLSFLADTKSSLSRNVLPAGVTIIRQPGILQINIEFLHWSAPLYFVGSLFATLIWVAYFTRDPARLASLDGRVSFGVGLALLQLPLFMSMLQAFGRCSITIGDEKGVIFTGIRSFGRTRQFAMKQLTEVILAGARNQKGYLSKSIVIKAGQTLEFATSSDLLNDDQRTFVAAALVLLATNQEQL